MSEARIQIAYDGDALKDGEMDVRQLAPALLAIGDLLESANKALNDDSATVSVRVRSDFKQGSFEIDFVVVQSLAEQVKLWLTGGLVAVSAVEISTLLGFLESASNVIGINLIQLIRWLRGRRVDRVEQGNGNTVIIVANDGATVEVQKNVWILSQDRTVRTNLEAALRPLEDPGIDVFEVRHNGRTIERIQKDEYDTFRVPEDDEEQLVRLKQTMILELVSPVFREDRKWEFTDGDAKITATIDDPLFLADVEEGRTAFAKGDRLIVDLEKTQSRKGAKLVTENRIVRVRKHLRKDEQLQFDFNGEE